jgi:cell division protein FtsX
VTLRSDLGLGLRLSVGAGRQGLARLLLIASGIALAVGLLLSALGIFPAEDAVERRQGARLVRTLDPGESGPPDRLLADDAGTAFDNEPIISMFLAPEGDHPPVPPWLDRTLAPGEIVASPALAELLASDEGALLRPRFPGRVIATLDERWLLRPGELVAYVGAEPRELSRHHEVVEGFGPHPEYLGQPSEGVSIEQPLFQVTFLVSIGLLIPIVAFVVTGSRLSASARESRLAAIRLVGGTPAQVRLVAAGESVLASALGCLLGIGLFLAGRALLAALAPPGDRWFPSDIAPPPTVFVGVLVGVIALSVGASLLSLRRVVVTPLGVVRGARRPIRATWRWAMLGTGLGGLLIVMLSGRAIIANDRIALPMVVISYGLTGFGAAASAPLAGSAIATALARIWRGNGVMLGARRLRADPRAAGRTVAGVVIVVIAATVTSLYVGVYEAQAGDSSFPSSLLRSTVIVAPVEPQPIPYNGLGDVEGVQAVAPVWIGYTRNGYNVLVSHCGKLDLAVEGTLPRCREGDAYVNGTLYDGNPLRPMMRIHLHGAPRLRVIVSLARVQRADLELGGYFHHDILVSTSSTSLDLSSRAVPSVIYVATDGDPATVERIRNALYGPSAPNVSPRGEPEDYADEVPALVGGAVTLGLLITFAVAAATMLITTVDAVGERRRSLAALAAVGASRSVLRRALAVETALPMVAGVALGLGSAIAGTWMLFQAVADFEAMIEAPPIYWRSLGSVLTFAIVATVVATIATFPSLGRAIRPESLRTE